MMSTERIGSDFAYPEADVRTPQRSDPRVYGILLRSGRQALAVAARAHRHHGRVWLPEFHCESMVAPFVAAGLHLSFYPLDAELWPEPEALLAARDAVVLVAPYFGRETPQPLPEVLAELVARESTSLVVDETHAVFDARLPADVHVASLRKLLPVGEGAYVSGVPGSVSLPHSVATDYEIRESAMRLRAAGREQFDASRVAFREAEEKLEASVEPQGADPRTVDLLTTLDVHTMRERRLANGRAFVEALEAADVESDLRPLSGYDGGTTPAYLTCVTERPRELQANLARHGIYCPIHWPESGYGDPGRWRRDLISFPVDHRYGTAHMQRMVDEVSRHFRSTR